MRMFELPWHAHIGWKELEHFHLFGLLGCFDWNLGQARLAQSQSAEPTLDAWALGLSPAQVVNFAMFVSNLEASKHLSILCFENLRKQLY